MQKIVTNSGSGQSITIDLRLADRKQQTIMLKILAVLYILTEAKWHIVAIKQ